MVSLEVFIDIILPAQLGPGGVRRKFSGGGGG